MIIWILTAIVLIVTAVILFLNLNPVFGGKPSKTDKADYALRAENYANGKFTYPASYMLDGLSEDRRVSKKGVKPTAELPIMAPCIEPNPAIDKVYVTWLGHSSLLIQMHGMNILIDPICANRASPLSFIGPRRFSEIILPADTLAHIDMVLVSHDHYDHLDMETVKALDEKTDRFIVPLGAEHHLTRWGIAAKKIHSMAWWEELDINGLTIACTPARHFSGRTFLDAGRTLFASWVLRDAHHQIYESGDGGFGGHFEAIHEKYGDFDLVMTDCAQYNMKWHTVHMLPEEAAMACGILGAKSAMPIHWGAYVLSTHGWDDSARRFTAAAEPLPFEVVTPMLGQTMDIDDPERFQDRWWEGAD